MKTKNTHGGKRKGAGRPKGDTNIVRSVTIKKALNERLNAKFGSKEVTRLMKSFLKELDCS